MSPSNTLSNKTVEQMAKGNRCSSTTKLDSWKIKVGINIISLRVNLVSVLRKKVRKQGSKASGVYQNLHPISGRVMTRLFEAWMVFVRRYIFITDVKNLSRRRDVI